MVQLTVDPSNPDKLFLTATVTLYIDRILIESLSNEIKRRITWQLSREVKSNPEVKKAIAKAAQKKLLAMLEIPEVEDPDITVAILGKESLKGDQSPDTSSPTAKVIPLDSQKVYREGPEPVAGDSRSTQKGPMSVASKTGNSDV